MGVTAPAYARLIAGAGASTPTPGLSPL